MLPRGENHESVQEHKETAPKPKAERRRMLGRLSVALKLGIPLVLVTVVAALILGASAVSTARQREYASYTAEAVNVAAEVEREYFSIPPEDFVATDPDFPPEGDARLVQYMGGLLLTHPSLARISLVYGPAGGPPEVWLSTTPQANGKEFPVKMLAGMGATKQRNAELDGEDVIETVVPMELSNNVVSMAVYTKGSVRDAAIGAVTRQTAIAAGLVILMEFLVLFPTLYLLVVRRVKRLGRAATAVAEGDFTVRIPEAGRDPGRDELAAVAREFDRMIATVAARTKQQAAVAELGQHALSGTDLSHLLDEAVELVAIHLDVALSAILELEGSGACILRAGRGWDDGAIGFASVETEAGSQAGYTLLTDEPVVMEDIEMEARFTPSELQRQHDIVSAITVVIPGQERPFGVLAASSQVKRDFSQDDLNFLVAVSSVLAAGIERKRAEEQVAFMAHHDELTELPNRAMFEELLDLSLARARRNDMAVAVLFMDLDNFKLVNDSLGHAAGDDLLRQLAERLREATRDTDLVARQGGDEFLVLLADIEKEAEQPLPEGTDNVALVAESVAVRIHQYLEDPFLLGEEEFYGSASIGISMFPTDADDARSLLKNADAAMYRSKKTSPGGYIVYSADGGDSLGKLSMTTRLRKAVENQNWTLFYQPLVELDSGKMTGVEALIRWQDPNGGMIPPGDFIPLAEEMGLIVAIGDWVMEEVCRQSRLWQDAGLDLKISFNLSPRQLWQPEIVEKVMAHLDSSAIDPSKVAIEITESSVMTDPERSQRVLWDLHARGVRLAIDDFGTGYSSLSRLKHMPVHTLKIDRSFVMDIPDDDDAGNMVQAVIQLAQSLGMSPLAEGIETPEQWKFLLEKGCEVGQGYYFSRPVPPEEIMALFQEHGQGVWATEAASIGKTLARTADASGPSDPSDRESSGS